MDTKEIKINVPKGYEIDKENSTFECIKFKPVQKKLPETWEEFCVSYNRTTNEYWITEYSILTSCHEASRDINDDKNIYPSKELAKAALALCQLIQLRDCYNDGWTPDWTDSKIKYVIVSFENALACTSQCGRSNSMYFKSEELRNEFFQNFRDLLESELIDDDTLMMILEDMAGCKQRSISSIT